MTHWVVVVRSGFVMLTNCEWNASYMNRYYLVVIADNIRLERGTDIPIAGFVAPRCIKARDEQSAKQLVKIQLLKDWKNNFNRDNKAGTPRLVVEYINRITNPFKRLRHPGEFFFFGVDEERLDSISRARSAFNRWFRIR